jgi:exodeoxyribonuclease III
MNKNHLKLLSWNVNGIRAMEKKGFSSWLQGCGADVVMLQETKCSPEQLTPALCKPDGFHAEWCAAEKKGYSGVVTYSRVPAVVSRGLSDATFDSKEWDVDCVMSCGTDARPERKEEEKRCCGVS